MNKTLVIVPAFNEKKHLSYVINDLKTYLLADILVINDHSNDETEQIIQEEKNITYLSHPVNLGYFRAIETGLKFALVKNYYQVIFFDADGQHIAQEAAKMLENFNPNKMDVLIGSRFIKDYGYHHGFLRRIGTNIFKGIIKFLTGHNITDPTSGLKILSRPVIEFLVAENNFPEYLDANLIVELLRSGFKVGEIPVKMNNRSEKGMYKGIIGPGIYMMKIFTLIGITILNYG